MNNCAFIGNLTRDPEIRTTQGGTKIASFTIACQRKFKNKQTGNYDSDFIRCTAFKNTADIIEKYFLKGSRIGVQGSMHTDSYEKNGVKIPSCECWVDSIDFCNGAKTEAKNEPKPKDPEHDLFDMCDPILPDSDLDVNLPF